MIHVAGPMFAGLQRCTRCGFILTDYRGDVWVPSAEAHELVPSTDSGDLLRGFAEGSFIEVMQQDSARYSAVTDDPPNCVPVQ